MKNSAKRIFGAVLVLSSVSAWAQERVSVTLTLPNDFIKKTCPAPVWKGSSLSWKGITDARATPEIGSQSKKKGKDVVLVDSSPPLATFLEAPMKELFGACGLKLVDDKADITMSAEIREFYAGVEKTFFTGKGVAKSNLLFRLKKANDPADRTVEVGYEIDSKKIRQKDLKQLQQTLNDLLAHTLEQVPKLDGFKEF